MTTFPASVVLLMLYLIQLALRFPDRPLAVHALAYTFSLVMIALVSPFIRYGPWALSATGVTAVDTVVADHKRIVPALLTALAAANILVGVWGLLVLLRFRRAFDQAATWREEI